MKIRGVISMELSNEAVSKIFSKQLMSLPMNNIKGGGKDEKRWDLFQKR